MYEVGKIANYLNNRVMVTKSESPYRRRRAMSSDVIKQTEASHGSDLIQEIQSNEHKKITLWMMTTMTTYNFCIR